MTHLNVTLNEHLDNLLRTFPETVERAREHLGRQVSQAALQIGNIEEVRGVCAGFHGTNAHLVGFYDNVHPHAMRRRLLEIQRDLKYDDGIIALDHINPGAIGLDKYWETKMVQPDFLPHEVPLRNYIWVYPTPED